MDLYNNKYPLEVIKRNIYSLNLLDILKTQVLTARFVVHYILNPQYQLLKHEEDITIQDVIFFQPHIKLYEIVNEKLIYDSDSDSLDNDNFS